MTETAMLVIGLVAFVVLLLVPLVYICILGENEDRYRRLVGLIRLLKRTTPRQRRQLPRFGQRAELDNNGGNSAS